MKRLIITVLFCLTCMAGFGHAANTQTTGKDPGKKPRAVFPETRHTFEPVLEGAKIEYDFIVHNQGTATLEILKTETG